MAGKNAAAKPAAPAGKTAPTGPSSAQEAASATRTAPTQSGPARAVWAALVASPGATAAAIAAAAGVSKTAAHKALAALEADGRATRIAGGRDGGKRAPDAWQPATTAATPIEDTDSADSTTANGADTAGKAEPTSHTPTTDEATAASKTPAPEAPSSEEAAVEGMDPAAVAEACAALADIGEVVTAALDALQTGDRTGALAAAETMYSTSGKARRLVRAAASGRPRSAAGRAKSHPGALRTKVAAHLAAHPDTDFTPHQIGTAIGHSAGAVANALDRLVSLGEAVETNERPRRFRATAPPADAAAAHGAPDAPSPKAQ